MAKKCFRCRGAINFVSLTRYPVTTREDDVILVLDLPAQRCVQCGQLFFTPEITAMLDGLRRGEIVAPRRRLAIGAYAVPTALREATKAQVLASDNPLG